MQQLCPTIPTISWCNLSAMSQYLNKSTMLPLLRTPSSLVCYAPATAHSVSSVRFHLTRFVLGLLYNHDWRHRVSYRTVVSSSIGTSVQLQCFGLWSRLQTCGWKRRLHPKSRCTTDAWYPMVPGVLPASLSRCMLSARETACHMHLSRFQKLEPAMSPWDLIDPFELESHHCMMSNRCALDAQPRRIEFKMPR